MHRQTHTGCSSQLFTEKKKGALGDCVNLIRCSALLVKLLPVRSESAGDSITTLQQKCIALKDVSANLLNHHVVLKPQDTMFKRKLRGVLLEATIETALGIHSAPNDLSNSATKTDTDRREYWQLVRSTGANHEVMVLQRVAYRNQQKGAYVPSEHMMYDMQTLRMENTDIRAKFRSMEKAKDSAFRLQKQQQVDATYQFRKLQDIECEQQKTVLEESKMHLNNLQ
ncbi:hypothetical protein PAMP_013497 [Pampus punctatissimus]